ncbi:MAG: putative tellurium resistance membrane protein TerC [Saprospiraceae bacterium]|jgi:predicted tellurium resistance membrane protein TerC
MELLLPDFATPEVWMSLLTLTFLEIVLGIDNIVFISLVSGRLPKEHQKRQPILTIQPFRCLDWYF